MKNENDFCLVHTDILVGDRVRFIVKGSGAYGLEGIVTQHKPPYIHNSGLTLGPYWYIDWDEKTLPPGGWSRNQLQKII